MKSLLRDAGFFAAFIALGFFVGFDLHTYLVDHAAASGRTMIVHDQQVKCFKVN